MFNLIFKVSVQRDDVLILCTDGVWSVIEDEEFAEITKKTNYPEELCRQIIELAMERDSDDNLSIIVLHFNNLVSRKTSKDKKKWSINNIFSRNKK